MFRFLFEFVAKRTFLVGRCPGVRTQRTRTTPVLKTLRRLFLGAIFQAGFWPHNRRLSIFVSPHPLARSIIRLNRTSYREDESGFEPSPADSDGCTGCTRIMGFVLWWREVEGRRGLFYWVSRVVMITVTRVYAKKL